MGRPLVRRWTLGVRKGGDGSGRDIGFGRLVRVWIQFPDVLCEDLPSQIREGEELVGGGGWRGLQEILGVLHLGDTRGKMTRAV